jgi:hypothetical protein
VRRAAVRWFLLAVAACLIVVGCSGSDDSESGTTDETTNSQTEDGQTGDENAPDGSGAGQDTEQGAGGVGIDDGDEADVIETVEPGPRFERLPGSLFGDRSAELNIEGLALAEDDTIVIAGSLVNGPDRSVAAATSTLTVDGTAIRGPENLPTPGRQWSEAYDVALDGEQLIIVGEAAAIGDPQRSEPAIWVGSTTGPSWRFDTLDVPAGLSDVRATAVVTNDDGAVSHLVGVGRSPSGDRPVLWRAVGGRWEPATGDGERDDGSQRDLIPLDAMFLEAGSVDAGFVEAGSTGTRVADDPGPLLLMVGVEVSGDGRSEPRVWLDDGGRLQQLEVTGLPPFGVLSSVAWLDDQLVAAGASSDDGRSTPILATTGSADFGPDPSTWSVVEADGLDLAGWVAFAGLTFGSIVVDEGSIYAALTDPVVQQVYRSDDGGQRWERQGNLSGSNDQWVPVAEIAESGGRLITAGGTRLMMQKATGWGPIVSTAVPTQRGSFQAVDVVAGPDGVVIGGGRRSAEGTATETTAERWVSPDGSTWTREQLPNSIGSTLAILGVDSAGQAVGVTFGADFFAPGTLHRQGSNGSWTSTSLDLGSIAVTGVFDVGRGALAIVGSRPRVDLTSTDPVVAIVDQAGEVREVPITSSPIPDGVNSSVLCLAGELGNLLAVVSWGGGSTGVLTGTNGERWRGGAGDGELDELSIGACGYDGDQFLVGGSNGAGQAVVARSATGETWSVEVVADVGAVLGVSSIGDATYLVGWVPNEDGTGSDGAIWRPADGTGRWELLSDIGLNADRFARQIQVTGLAEFGDVIVAIGQDRARAGAWVADRLVLEGAG